MLKVFIDFDKCSFAKNLLTSHLLPSSYCFFVDIDSVRGLCTEVLI